MASTRPCDGPAPWGGGSCPVVTGKHSRAENAALTLVGMVLTKRGPQCSEQETILGSSNLQTIRQPGLLMFLFPMGCCHISGYEVLQKLSWGEISSLVKAFQAFLCPAVYFNLMGMSVREKGHCFRKSPSPPLELGAMFASGPMCGA